MSIEIELKIKNHKSLNEKDEEASVREWLEDNRADLIEAKNVINNHQNHFKNFANYMTINFDMDIDNGMNEPYQYLLCVVASDTITVRMVTSEGVEEPKLHTILAEVKLVKP